MPSVYDVIVDQELAEAGAPPRPSLGYLVQAILHHANDDIKTRFLPGLISGEDRWCQGFSEPDAGSDLASLRTRAVRDGDEYVITGHKVWTSYSDLADLCFLLARTDPDVPKHRGLSIFAVRMDQPGIQQRPLPMINGITREFGEVTFDEHLCGLAEAASEVLGQLVVGREQRGVLRDEVGEREAGVELGQPVGAEPRELSLLYTVFYIAASGDERNIGTFERNFNTRDGAQERRFVGGSGVICEELARRLGKRVVLRSPVTRIIQSRTGVRLESKRLRVRAKRAIVAIPPVLAGEIDPNAIVPAATTRVVQYEGTFDTGPGPDRPFMLLGGQPRLQPHVLPHLAYGFATAATPISHEPLLRSGSTPASSTRSAVSGVSAADA
jgi:hypothetical protein